MTEFKAGRDYYVNDMFRSEVKVLRKTKCYLLISGGNYTGWYKIRKENILDLGEHIIIPVGKLKCFCFAGHELKN